MRIAPWIAALALVATLAAAAPASVPPVGKLPAGPVSTIRTTTGQLFAIALPGQKQQALGWRIARPYKTAVVRGVDEANVGASRNVVVVYRAVGPGTTRIVYALTRNETPKALRAATYVVTVSRR
jgi:hypothetical protein